MNSSLNIPIGSDLNQEETKVEPITFEQIPDNVFDTLPDFLIELTDLFSDRNERDTFFISALAIISGILPDITSIYDGKTIGANLYVFIVAKYGVGKGIMSFAQDLGTVIHSKKLEASKVNFIEYKKDQSRYKKDLKNYLANSKSNPYLEPPTEPEEPAQEMLFIPANNSSSGMYKNLRDNNGAGIIAESEGDTLAISLKTDYGNFSDVLRKAFHHERLSLNRKTESEYIEILNPSLSTLLTSTFDQLLKLIPSIENGLFSRLIFHTISRNPNFENPFDPRKSERKKHIQAAASQLSELYDLLNSGLKPIVFELTTEQQKAMVKHFQGVKDELAEYVSEDLDGTTHRLGVIAIRVAMILATLREVSDGTIGVNDKIICDDTDFKNALLLSDVFKRNALKMYYTLQADLEQKVETVTAKDEQRIADKKECLRLYSLGQHYREIALTVLGSKKKSSTVYRWINELSK